VRRELRGGSGVHGERLAAVGCADDAELAAGLRSGRLDVRDDDVRAAVCSGTLTRLAVADPRYPFPRDP
jgi:hypothetical protein